MGRREDSTTIPRPRCTGETAAPLAVSLPVVGVGEAAGGAAHGGQGGIRPSGNAKKRAIVLAAVQIVLIAHIAIWAIGRHYGLFGGKTISPIEPSESMEFVKNGVVNAGLIFFSLALLSTFIFGRWFCGWGCHVLLLQDLCGWMMKRAGIRPKPFRSRLLIYVPFLLALYMFIWPAAYRWGLVPLHGWMMESLGADHWMVSGMSATFGAFGVPLPMPAVAAWQPEWHLATEDFWRTFPGFFVAVPFLLICGFATVYFLGSKGFCTYGCPYGGFFAPLDKLSPGRIRVTDACEQCGHCTAVCTSNVRVHDEVREFGMVVDPGCMKCFDCVSVCPNDALYFGFGKPAVLKGAAKNEKPKKHYDMTWREEIAIAAVFVLTFYAVRGVYGVIPFLMAAGVAGVVSFMTWKLWRMVRDEHVNLHRYRLKYRGAWKRSGWVFAGITVMALALTAHSGVVNVFRAAGNRFDERVTIPATMVFAEDRRELSPAMAEDARRALRYLQLASSIERGGIGLLSTTQSEIDFRMAWLHSTLGEFDDAQQCMEQIIEREGLSEGNATSLFRIFFAAGKRDEARTLLTRVASEQPGAINLLADGAAWLAHENQGAAALELTAKAHAKQPDDLAARRLHAFGMLLAGNTDGGVAETIETTKQPAGSDLVFAANRPEPAEVQMLDRIVVELVSRQMGEEALRVSRAALEQYPKSLQTMRRLSLLEVQVGDPKRGIDLIRKTIEIDPSSVGAHYTLALTLARQGEFREAYDAMRKAMAMHPDPPGPPGPWYMQMAEICAALGRGEEAQLYATTGERLLQQP